MLKIDEFADVKILRYYVPGFENLDLKQKKLIYYLSQATLCGRDILYDQNNKYNLAIRKTLELIYEKYKGDRSSKDFAEMVIYLKRVWFSNGIHHHYGEDKFMPTFSKEFFIQAIMDIPLNLLPLSRKQTKKEFIDEICKVIFDPDYMSKKVNQKKDVIVNSANNYYGSNITQEEVKSFYSQMNCSDNKTPISYGLNSRLEKKNNQLLEKIWKKGGLYGQAITEIIKWLEKAKNVAENKHQEKVIDLLMEFYATGNLDIFDEYSIEWVKDTSNVDFINGFIEVYGDALGIKGSWEALVNFENKEATKRANMISRNAQWFEDNSPVHANFKKTEVIGVTAKVITVAQLGGDCYPTPPIGINLPNSNWIRTNYGSKSVTIENIMEAYNKDSQDNGFNKEFVWSDKELELLDKYGLLTDMVHTDLHECLGHGSGKILDCTPPNALGEYHSAIEETRADLFGLYYIADAKMIELGILPDENAYKAEYYKFMMNGLLTQLVRVEINKNLEEAHMQNRQLIAKWVLIKGEKEGVVQLTKKENKTYVVVNDYKALRNLFGQLLAEIQRITSEGDKGAAQILIEKYATKIDEKLHSEILDRYKKLKLKPYKGFVNPNYQLITDEKGEIIEVTIDYKEGYMDQMMRYSKDYSTLPTYND